MRVARPVRNHRKKAAADRQLAEMAAVADNLSDNVAANVADNLSDNVADNLSDNLSDNDAVNFAENVADNLSANVANNLSANVADNVAAGPMVYEEGVNMLTSASDKLDAHTRS